MGKLLETAALLVVLGASRAWGACMNAGLSAWLVPWDEADDGVECFDELHPFAFAFSTSPAAAALPHPEFLRQAERFRRPGLQMIPVIVNDVYEGGRLKTLKSDRALRALLMDKAAVSRHVDALVGAAEDFDGIEVDYERVPLRCWWRFADFIEILGRALHARGKKLYVDLEPPRFYRPDLARRFGPRLAAAADQLVVMAYYERGSFALRPGPGVSLDWALRVARWAQGFIPPEKLTVALSSAGTDWSPVFPGPIAPWRGRRLHYAQGLDRLAQSRGKLERADASSPPRFTISIHGRTHEFRLEDEISLRAKIFALRAIGVRRIGLWYWGRRHPDFKTLGSGWR